MNESLERIKNHVRRHKVVYLVGAGATVVVASMAVIGFKKIDTVVINDAFKFQWKSPTSNQIITGLSDPTNYAKAILDLDNNVAYESQNHAAKAFGWTSRQMSSYLNGLIDMPGSPNLERLERLLAG